MSKNDNQNYKYFSDLIPIFLLSLFTISEIDFEEKIGQKCMSVFISLISLLILLLLIKYAKLKKWIAIISVIIINIIMIILFKLKQNKS